MSSPAELAFFGGWRVRALAGGDHKWGPPSWRVQEFVPSSISGVFLPPLSSGVQPGVPYWVLNSGTAQVVVRKPDGVTLRTMNPGVAAYFVLGGFLETGGDWIAGPVGGSISVGSVYPALRYSVDVTTNTANLDLLERVVAQGYDGTQPAVVACRIRAGVAVGTTHRLNRALTTGNTFGGVSWAAGSFALLTVEATAIVAGWGGDGGGAGAPGTGSANGIAGENGGQAIRAEIPLRIDCQGLIIGGAGGGGGGGSSSTIPAPPAPMVVGGGGGGGRGGNMSSTGVLLGSSGGFASPPAGLGSGGGPFATGLGGLGTGGGGNGGNGGLAASNGTSGGTSSTGATGGAAGLAGAAISYLTAAGAPTVLAGGSNILGGSVAEAS